MPSIDISPSLIEENQARYGTRVSFWMLVQACGGWNEALDAILDDSLPADLRQEANEVVDRTELIARSHYRLARALEAQSKNG